MSIEIYRERENLAQHVILLIFVSVLPEPSALTRAVFCAHWHKMEMGFLDSFLSPMRRPPLPRRPRRLSVRQVHCRIGRPPPSVKVRRRALFLSLYSLMCTYVFA